MDHIRPLLLGGTSAPDNLRLICRKHNLLHAEQVYGREHVDRYRRGGGLLARDGDDVAWGVSAEQMCAAAAATI